MSRFRAIFNEENIVMVSLTRIFDMIWVSILYVLFCIPIVTIGAATSSLYYVCAKVLRHGEGYVWREFIHGFKMNFKQATIFWVIIALIYVLLGWNINLIGLNNPQKNDTTQLLAAVYLVMMLLLFFITIYVFPIISRFNNKFMMTFRFALFCAFRHFLHTIAVLILALAGGFYCFFFWGNPLLAFGIILPGLITFIVTYPMEHVLRKYTPKTETKYDESGQPIRMWYED